MQRVITAGLCGVYNYTDDDSTLASFQSFVTHMVSDGSKFLASDTRGNHELTEGGQILNHFSSKTGSLWTGRLTISHRQFLNELKTYVQTLSRRDVEEADRVRWLKTVERYRDLTVTVDFVGRGVNAYPLITYWTAMPEVIEGNSDLQDSRLAVEEASKVLVDDLWFEIDNFFSEYLETAWHFTFTPGQLRKPAFIFFVGIDGGPVRLGEIRYLDLLLFRTLLSDSAEVEEKTLSPHLAMFFAKGCVGMTGQPNLKRTPILYLLIMDDSIDDAGKMLVLRNFSEVEKLCATSNEHSLDATSPQMMYEAIFGSEESHPPNRRRGN